MNQEAEILHIGSTELDRSFYGIVGESVVMQRVYSAIRKVANTNATVLIEGPTGVGKELVARAVHLSSPRRDRPYVAMNCGAVPPHLIADDLFGHERGAYTDAKTSRQGRFEAAHGGTLLLDDITTMPLTLQPHLLRVLQEREVERVGSTKTVPVDVRVIVTTNVSLASCVEGGTFRPDLYHRLNVVSIKLPPLCERPQDIEALVEHFIALYNQQHQCDIAGINAGSLQKLSRYAWPGNVRELQHTIERAVIMCNRNYLTEADFPMDVLTPHGLSRTDGVIIPPTMTIDELINHHLLTTFERCNRNRTHTGSVLGIHAKTVFNRLQQLGYDVDGAGGRDKIKPTPVVKPKKVRRDKPKPTMPKQPKERLYRGRRRMQRQNEQDN